MTTARQLIRFAFNQLIVTGVGEEPTAEDSADALFMLNTLVASWRNDGVDLFWTDLTLDDDVSFWVPSKTVDGATIDAATYQGTWDVSTNTPALNSGIGTNGYVYKVSVAGTRTLDLASSWSVGDYVVFDGLEQTWMKCVSQSQVIHPISTILAARMSSLFGVPAGPEIESQALRAWYQIQALYVRAPVVAVDDALRRMNSNRYINGNLL